MGGLTQFLLLGLLVMQHVHVESVVDPVTSILISTAIATGASLAGQTALSLSSSGRIRNVVIEISNHLHVPLYGGNHYIKSGVTSVPPISVMRALSKEVMQFQKTGGTATGTSGIVSYTIANETDPATFVIIWSVPFDYNWSKNWFGLKIVPEETNLDKNLYREMYKDKAWDNPAMDVKYAYASEGKTLVISHNNYIISAVMSDAGHSVIKLDIQQLQGGYHRHHKKFRG